MIKITYQTTKKDFEHFNFFVLKRKLFRKAMFLPLSVWIVGLLSIGVMLFPRYYLILKDAIIFASVFFVATAPLTIIGFCYLQTKLMADYNYDRFPLQYGAKTIGFDTNGIHILSTVTNKNSDTVVPWSYIQEIVMNSQYIYIFQSKSVAYPIPLRIFESSEQANTIYEELKNLISRTRNKMPDAKESVVIEE